MDNKVDDYQGEQEKPDKKNAPIDTENTEESAQSKSVSDADTAKIEAPKGSKQTKEIRDEESEEFSDLENTISGIDDIAPDDPSDLAVEDAANDDPSGLAAPDFGRAEATSVEPPSLGVWGGETGGSPEDFWLTQEEQALRNIGSKRREELFEEIQELHREVPDVLHGNKEDVSFALRTLSEANDIIIEDPRQYDEALYRVAIVKTMLKRKKYLVDSTSRYSIRIFVYGCAWVVACIVGYIISPILISLFDPMLGDVVTSVWFAGLAGGLGGASSTI